MKWFAEPRARRRLEAVLQRLNRSGSPVGPGSAIDAWLDFPSRRLAVYGTLAPGEANHREVAHLRGSWETGFVRGDKSMIGWGADLGFPVLTWRPQGPVVPVRLLTSDDLPLHAARLDAFEGDEYRRTLIPVDGTAPRVKVAYVYTQGSSDRDGSDT